MSSSLPSLVVWLFVGVTLVAALVNGGLGYGFSSITVPVALLFFPNRVLNPALVLAEVAINVAIFAVNRRAGAQALRHAAPVVLGVIPGVLLGSWLLASAPSGGLRVATYCVLLPLIIAQTAGLRWKVKPRRGPRAALGVGVGALYACTTLSGPPLALFFNNDGLGKEDFRAALGLVRVAESGLTAFAYLGLGLYSPASLRTTGLALPGILVGLPLGHGLLRKVPAETFRRVCMGTDALLVSFGLARALLAQGWAQAGAAYGLMGAVTALELVLLGRYLRGAKVAARVSEPHAELVFAKGAP